MDYSRATPRARSGTSGISVDEDITAAEGGNMIWLAVPERIAAVTVAVHIPDGAEAEYRIEATCSSPEKLGKEGAGGYWDAVEDESPTYSESKVVMLANAVTAIRVVCLSASWGAGAGREDEPFINVCFCA